MSISAHGIVRAHTSADNCLASIIRSIPTYASHLTGITHLCRVAFILAIARAGSPIVEHIPERIETGTPPQRVQFSLF